MILHEVGTSLNYDFPNDFVFELINNNHIMFFFLQIKMWITYMIPRIEDGNNFGVSIQVRCPLCEEKCSLTLIKHLDLAYKDQLYIYQPIPIIVIFYQHIKYPLLNMLKKKCDKNQQDLKKNYPDLSSLLIFTHLKLWIASSRHNFKWVKIPITVYTRVKCDVFS